MATFADRVKEQRLKRGLSQPQLAEDIGLTKQTISLWERGVRRPEFETMLRVADYFGVSFNYLVGQTDDPTIHPDEDVAVWYADEIGEIEGLAVQLSQLSVESRQIVAAAIREAYQVDSESGRLSEWYIVSAHPKRSRMS